jgi:hypothetical protein
MDGGQQAKPLSLIYGCTDGRFPRTQMTNPAASPTSIKNDPPAADPRLSPGDTLAAFLPPPLISNYSISGAFLPLFCQQLHFIPKLGQYVLGIEHPENGKIEKLSY